MKQETNNEMDLLLRRFGRRDDEVVSGDHLDADELCAYAENALPAAARARYTAHLAECSRCRGFVVQLTSAAGVVVATESAKVSEPSGWKKFLASLLTPMVLRYAAPALGLIVVAAIGFVVLRSRQPAKDVAQVTNSEQSPAARASEPSGNYANDDATKSKPTPQAGLRGQERTQSAGAPAPALVPNAPQTVTSVETEVSKDKAVAQPKPEEQPASVAANEPPPAKTVPTTVDEVAKTSDTAAAKKEDREAPAAPAPADKATREERQDKDNFARARKSGISGGVQGGATVQSGRDSSNFMFSARTVAGRQFQKKGSVWIDTAYDSSKDVVTLKRDSEQYRALVADEPAIKTIADTLEGEIIVVWKTRTYRIR